MFDINASYNLTNSASGVRILSFANGVATLAFESKNEHLTSIKHTMTVDLRAVLKEAATAQAEQGDDYTTKAPVVVKDSAR